MAGGKIIKGRKCSSRHSASHPKYQSGICYKKSEGQHILKDAHVIDDIVAKSGIKSTDVILEIGPGTGKLTKRLFEEGKKVVAIEKDPRMVLILNKTFHGTPLGDRLEVINADVLKCDPFPYFDICVSNIPYQISSPLIDMLLSSHHQWAFRCVVLMLQEEYGKRLCAKPGEKEYSRLTVNTQHLAYVSLLKTVGKNCFCPPPKVGSCVVRIEPKKKPMTCKGLDGLIRICFTRKNRTLGAIFRHKSVLSLLGNNYKTLVALQQLPQLQEMASELVFLNEESEDENGDDEDIQEKMEVENGFRDKVLTILKEGNFEEKRASNLKAYDFVRLLSLFNKAGIHFA